MSAAPVSTTQPTHRRSRELPWAENPAPWASLAIAAMWLAVLFVGLWGGDFVSTSGSGATSTTIPAAVILGLFALPCTIAIARRGFAAPPEAAPWAALDAERRAREQLAEQVARIEARAPDAPER